MRKKGPAVHRVEHPKFPVDFFEHCQQLQYSDIEVGGEREEVGNWESGNAQLQAFGYINGCTIDCVTPLIM